MKIIQIVHNPTAGKRKHGRESLMDLVKETGHLVNYVSTDENNWKEFIENEMDAILVAGGDGTLHKVANELRNNPEKKVPIYLLPIGTANNIAKTLQIPRRTFPLAESFDKSTESYDCGKVIGLSGEDFFVESIGFGIFPELISEMKKNYLKEDEDETAPDKLKRTVEVFLKIVKEFKGQKAKIKFDGITVKGKFLLIELMNIKYLGPNLKLAPRADPSDGYFDLVMIAEENRHDLERYLENIIQGKTTNDLLEKFVKTIRVRKAKFKYKGPAVHVDDNLITDYEGKSLKVEIIPGALEFLGFH